MVQCSYGLVIAMVLTSACGRVNYDPKPLTDASPGAIDADPELIDAEVGLPDAAAAACNGETGTYLGDDSSGRIIALGFQPAIVIVQSDSGTEAVMRMSSMPTNSSKSLIGAQAMITGMLSHTAGGFALGPNALVNKDGVRYHWVAFPDSSSFTGGQYLGNGSSQSITGLGFSPEWMLVADEADGVAVMRMPDSAALTNRLDDGTSVPDGVSTLDADGFSLGSRPFVNAINRTFHYVAWRSSPGQIATGNYVGAQSADQVVSGLGLRPSYMLVNGVAAGGVMHRFESLAPFFSMSVNAQTPIFDAIMSFFDGGFSVGTLPRVGALGADYYYSAFATCSAP